MTAPTYAWVLPDPAWEYGAGIQWPSTMATAVRNNLIHLEEWLGHSFTAVQNHDHDNANSAFVDPWLADNLILNPCPTAIVVGLGEVDIKFWTRSHDYITAVGTNYSGVLLPGQEDESLYQIMGYDEEDLRSQGLFGSRAFGSRVGTTFVCSMYAKATAVPTAGLIAFGLADGSITEHMDGCALQVDFTDLETTWKRFWGRMTISTKRQEDMRFLIHVKRKLTAGIHVSGFMVHIGKRLLPFTWPNILGMMHDGYANISRKVPVWDKSIALTNAVQLTAV